jgi:hypothetical protein
MIYFKKYNKSIIIKMINDLEKKYKILSENIKREEIRGYFGFIVKVIDFYQNESLHTKEEWILYVDKMKSYFIVYTYFLDIEKEETAYEILMNLVKSMFDEIFEIIKENLKDDNIIRALRIDNDIKINWNNLKEIDILKNVIKIKDKYCDQFYIFAYKYDKPRKCFKRDYF